MSETRQSTLGGHKITKTLITAKNGNQKHYWTGFSQANDQIVVFKFQLVLYHDDDDSIITATGGHALIS